MDIEDHLRRFRVSDPTPELRERVLATIASTPAPRLRLRPWLAGAVAAGLLIGLGLWLWKGRENNHFVVSPDEERPAVAIFNGKGRVVPIGEVTRFTVVDAERGQVHLEQGELYVELPSDAGLRAEIATPAGTATALGTRFFAHCPPRVGAMATTLLAVAVLDGTVMVSNAHGHTVGGGGEVVLAEHNTAPERHSGVGHQHLEGCPYVGTLTLLHRPRIQEELKLSEEQLARLQRPGKDERLEICRFFRGLTRCPHHEWSKKTSEFVAVRQQQIAAILNQAQQKRLREIGFQQEGFFALTRAETAEALDLTPMQRQQVASLVKDYGKRYSKLVSEAAPELSAKVRTLRGEVASRLGELLNERQRKHWEQRMGKPFDLGK